MKRILSFILAVCMLLSMQVCVNAEATSAITITTSSPWFEAGYVEWSDSSNAENYNVYYKKSGEADSAYVKIDSELVRGTRADILGIAGNTTYDVKVVPVLNGSEATQNAAVTQIEPMVYTREGFAFSDNSPHKRTTGGYNLDGTVKNGAKIYYITNENKDTIKDTVYKGTSGTECTGIGEIMKARESAKSTEPVIIRFLGTVETPSGVDSLSLLNIKTVQNVTLEGVGDDTYIKGWGFNLRGSQNIEVRNLSFGEFPDDSVSIQVDNINIWVHNNDFNIGKNGGGDKKKGDGSCDVKDDSTYVTISYNNFHSTGKTSLCGMKSETAGVGFVTYHHNWYNKSGSRHPRIRTITVHSYNNYYDHNYSGGMGATTGASVFLENNYFEDTVRPVFAAGQGNDIKEDGSSFSSGENGGVIKSFGNKFTTCGGEVTYLNSELEYVTTTCKGVTYFNGGGRELKEGAAAKDQPDCFNANSRDEKVPESFYAFKGGATYNNFDTNPNVMYSYNVDSPDDAKAKVIAYAGRVRNLDPKKPLVAPTNPSVVIKDDGSVLLTWDSVIGAAGYQVSYSVDGNLIDTVSSESPNYSVPNLVLTENQTISYSVSAVKADGSIGTSSQGSATYSAPDAPTDLALSTGNATITAKWNASKGASSYEVSILNGSTVVEKVNTTADEYTFGKLSDGVNYTVSVKAITGKLASSAITANATAVCYISEDNMDYKSADDDFDDYDDETGFNPDFAKWNVEYNEENNSNLNVYAKNGEVIIADKDNSGGTGTGYISFSRNIAPAKKGRFFASFDIAIGEKPNGANNFVRLMNGSNVVIALTINSQKIYVNSGEGATVSNKLPQGNTKATGVSISASTKYTFKIVGDIDKKVYDLYIGSMNEPVVKGAELVLADDFSTDGLNKFILQTSATKVHNINFDNFKVYGTDIDLSGVVEDNRLEKPANMAVDFDDTTKSAKVTWDTVDGAESYDVTYTLNGTAVSDSSLTGLTANECTVNVPNIKSGDVLKFIVVAKASSLQDSLSASASYTYSDGTETTTTSTTTEKSTESTTTSSDKTTESTTTSSDKTTESTTEQVHYGDVDDNGEIGINDAVVLLNYILDKSTKTDFNKKVADVDGNLYVDARDVSLIIKKVLDSSYKFPAGDWTPVFNPGESDSFTWDMADSIFDAYSDRASFGADKTITKINGLSFYYPATGITVSNPVYTVDGVSLGKYVKLNTAKGVITKAPTKNAIALEVKAGDKVTVYAGSSGAGKSSTVGFSDSTFNSQTKDVADKTPEKVEFVAESDGVHYIYAAHASESILVYQIKLN